MRFSGYSDEELEKIAEKVLDGKSTSDLAKRSLRDDLDSLDEKILPGRKDLIDSLEENNMGRFASLWKPFREQLDKLPEPLKESIKGEIASMDNAFRHIEEFGQNPDD